MPDTITEAPSARVPAPVWVLLALGAYFAVMTVQAALLAPSGRSDDTETLLLSQSLAWGYEAKNPPAFYWLAWGATTLFGPSLPVIYALRLAGVFAGFAGLYAHRPPGAARPAACRRRRARDARDAALPLVPAQLPDQYLLRAGAGAARRARAPAAPRAAGLGRLRAARRGPRARRAHPLQLRDLRRRTGARGARDAGLAGAAPAAAGAGRGRGRRADADAARPLDRGELGGAGRPGAEPGRRRRSAALPRAGARRRREPRRGDGQHPARPARGARGRLLPAGVPPGGRRRSRARRRPRAARPDGGGLPRADARLRRGRHLLREAAPPVLPGFRAALADRPPRSGRPPPLAGAGFRSRHRRLRRARCGRLSVRHHRRRPAPARPARSTSRSRPTPPRSSPQASPAAPS